LPRLGIVTYTPGMEFELPPEAETYRAEVRAFLAEHAPGGEYPADFTRRLAAAGYVAPHWPSPWGRGATPIEQIVIDEELRAAGAPRPMNPIGIGWAGPTLLVAGTPEQHERYLPGLLDGSELWCQLFSEPGAGSDLAGLACRGVRDGDEFVVTGQKVWTSGAKVAEYGMLVARTNWDVPKHRGISFFFLPMRQPGIEVRPIRQITGESHFNEVFIDAARVPAENLLGELGDGWRVLQTALAYERSLMGDTARGPRSAERDEDFGDTNNRGAEVDLVALARQFGRADDPVIRQDLMRVHTLRRVNAWNAARAKSQLAQGTSSPILSLGKLAMSRILHEGAHLQRRIVGAEALLAGRTHPTGDAANFMSLNAYFTSIGGGTDQIQRNIIGERVLGLPKEPNNDKVVPFSELPKNA
jgi:alkylation response protein AidB-like acyl-CoA dehydrogenase